MGLCCLFLLEMAEIQNLVILGYVGSETLKGAWNLNRDVARPLLEGPM